MNRYYLPFYRNQQYGDNVDNTGDPYITIPKKSHMDKENSNNGKD